MCLSLLGTWSGPGWIPGTSTLLQVLLSIQSLIFVDSPYFNEPGYDHNSPHHQRQSNDYNRQIRVATLQEAILGQIQCPSLMFEDCINCHFRLKKRYILEQVDEWEAMENEHDGQVSFIAGGGIPCSHKMMHKICDNIRKLINEKYH